MDLFFSQYFGVDASVVENYGAFDISVVSDLPLFIDPFLLFNSERPEYQALHEEIITYLIFLRDKATGPLSTGLINAWYRFKEVEQNCDEAELLQVAAVSEAIGARIEDLALERGHRTLTVLRKGGKTVTMPLAPRTARAIDLVVGERYEGTILYGNDGGRLDRHAAARIVRRIAKAAAVNKHIGPHTLRHGFITAALDAGVPLRDVQEAASHADPRTTMRYDRARVSLDRHATYIVSTFIAGAAR